MYVLERKCMIRIVIIRLIQKISLIYRGGSSKWIVYILIQPQIVAHKDGGRFIPGITVK